MRVVGDFDFVRTSIVGSSTLCEIRAACSDRSDFGCARQRSFASVCVCARL